MICCTKSTGCSGLLLLVRLCMEIEDERFHRLLLCNEWRQLGPGQRFSKSFIELLLGNRLETCQASSHPNALKRVIEK